MTNDELEDGSRQSMDTTLLKPESSKLAILYRLSLGYPAVNYWQKIYSETSLKRPPLKAVLNERWSLVGGKINMICKELATEKAQILHF